jgi:predicted dehydrogenase
MSYADDEAMARFYPYASHAQVLRDHPAFEWNAVIDRSEDALRAARERYGVELATTDASACASFAPEVAVVATPPGERFELLEALPSLRAVIVEKPLGRSEAEALRFVAECERRNIVVQVNLWRRADALFRSLAPSLESRIGNVQMGFAVYGNGLQNNGTHIVDFLRMLLGEVRFVQAVSSPVEAHGPIAGDIHVSFAMTMSSGPVVQVAPLGFRHYRENGIDLWGDAGRLTILQEGLYVAVARRTPNRAMTGEHEVTSDSPELLTPTVGRAFYEMYDDLARVLSKGGDVCSPASSALRSTKVIDAVIASAERSGARIELDK